MFCSPSRKHSIPQGTTTRARRRPKCLVGADPSDPTGRGGGSVCLTHALSLSRVEGVMSRQVGSVVTVSRRVQPQCRRRGAAQILPRAARGQDLTLEQTQLAESREVGLFLDLHLQNPWYVKKVTDWARHVLLQTHRAFHDVGAGKKGDLWT